MLHFDACSQYKQLKEQMKQAQMQPQLMGMPIQGTFLQGNNGNSGRGTMASSPNGIGHMVCAVSCVRGQLEP